MPSDTRKSTDPRNLNQAFSRDVSGTATYNQNHSAELQKQHQGKSAEFNKAPAAQKGTFSK